jgi:hypothetical protein
MPIAIPASLVRHLTNGRCALFVGAGLSVGAGLPDWKKLLGSMITDVESEDESGGAGAELRRLVVAGKLLEVADHCRQRLGERRYLELLGEQLRGGSGDIPEAHRIITELPFNALVTTNYDKLFERAYDKCRGYLPKVVTSRQRENLGSLLFSGGFFILKAHGDIDDAASLVLTARDYREIIHANPAFDALFSALLMTRSTLFVGYSLSDPDFRLLFDRQLSTFGENVPERYALMAGVGPIESDVLKRAANIKVLPYPEGKHEEVLVFLRSLKERVQAPAAERAEPKAAAPAPIQRVSPPMAPPRVSMPAPISEVPPPLAYLQLAAREDRLKTLLRIDSEQSLHMSEAISWSGLSRRLASLLEVRGGGSKDRYRQAGVLLAELLPKAEIRAVPPDRTLTIIAEGDLSAVPWELAMCDDREPLCLARAVVRALPPDPGAARGLPGLPRQVRVLVIGDPGVEPLVRLPGAYEEARAVASEYETSGATCTLLCREDAMLDTLNGDFDVIHFAGHAWFDRQESYLAFNGDERLTASELRSVLGRRPPAILVLNSHYTAFLPRGMRPAELEESQNAELPPTSDIGFTQMAVATGVGGFIGTFSSPRDLPAKDFGVRVHGELLRGTTIAGAVHNARRHTIATHGDDVSALQYVLSGYPHYRFPGVP